MKRSIFKSYLFLFNTGLAILLLISGCDQKSPSRVTYDYSTPPPALKHLRAVAVAEETVKLSWVDPSLVETTGYVVSESSGPDSEFLVVDSLPANEVSLELTGRVAEIPYRYFVKSYNGFGESESSDTTGVLDMSLILTLHPPLANGWIQAIAIDPDNQMVAVGVEFATNERFGVLIYSIETGQLIHQIMTEARVEQVEFSTQGGYLAVLEEDQSEIKLWSVETWWFTMSLQCDEPYVFTSLACQPLANKLTAVAESQYRLSRLMTWDLDNLTLSHSYEAESIAVNYRLLEYSPDGSKLACDYYDGRGGSGTEAIAVLNPNSFDILRLVEYDYLIYISDLCFSPDSRYLAASTFYKMVQIWDTETMSLAHTIEDTIYDIKSSVFSPDGNYLTYGIACTGPKLWDLTRQEVVMQIEPLNPDYVGAGYLLKYTSDNRYLIGAGYKEVSIWRVFRE